ncbi:MAG: hypothetical protein OXG56_00125 [Gammaproteobacteria bacterium]|nr:hypothetical protein [Gammaproteobacteria bacterium]
MNDNTDNLVLEHLKVIQTKIGNLSTDMQDIKMRLSEVGRGLSMVLSSLSDGYGSQVRQQSKIDQLSERIQRIETRLELVD